MSDFQIIMAVILAANAIVGGTLYKVLRDIRLDLGNSIKTEKQERKDADEIIHTRVREKSTQIEGLKDSKAKMELELERGKNACLQAVIDAKTEGDAKIAGTRSEFHDVLNKAIDKYDARLDRFENRMLTHDDADIHFKRLEEVLGKLTLDMEKVLSSLPRLDERIKSLEKV